MQGAMIGGDLLIVSGFKVGCIVMTAQNYALNTTAPSAIWGGRPMEDLQDPEGITDASFVVLGSKFYMRRLRSLHRATHHHLRAGGGIVYDLNRNATHYFSG